MIQTELMMRRVAWTKKGEGGWRGESVAERLSAGSSPGGCECKSWCGGVTLVQRHRGSGYGHMLTADTHTQEVDPHVGAGHAVMA